MKRFKRALVWLRRDLRLHDHTALSAAALSADSMAFVFVYDTKILGALKDKNDRRVSFIFSSLQEIDQTLRERGGQLIFRHGDPTEEIPKLAKAMGADLVCVNHDYESYGQKRDQKVEASLKKEGIVFESLKDQVIFERRELLTGGGTPFKVFTPYSNAWLKSLNQDHYSERRASLTSLLPQEKLRGHIQEISMKDLGFEKNSLWLEPGEAKGRARLKKFRAQMKNYKKLRDIPAAEATSGLSVHLRFGTVSIRECVREALEQSNEGAETWLKELIWRDFYHMILSEFPHVADSAFKKEYAKIKWPGSNAHFQAWCEGRTGFPIVDAAMRHFNETGWMHNRLRMIVASFLTKDLLVDWRKGEAYFARYLLDFDLAANNGGWQWSASTGCDAQPYFRIFNPESQALKFDPKQEFIRQYVKETIPPIVDHKSQRTKAIALFKDA